MALTMIADPALKIALSSLVGVHERDFDPALDSEERRVGTLYVDARRPDRT